MNMESIYIYLIVMILLTIPLIFSYIVRDKPLLPEYWFRTSKDLFVGKIVYLLVTDLEKHETNVLYARITDVEINKVFGKDVYNCTLNNGYKFTAIDCGDMPEFFPYFKCKTNDYKVCECHFSNETLKERYKTYNIINYNDKNPNNKFSYLKSYLSGISPERADELFDRPIFFSNKIKDI